MYRSNIAQILNNREPIRKEAFKQLDQSYRLVYGIARQRDRRKYISQNDFIYKTYLQKSDDYFETLTAIRELEKLQSKLRMWWYYEGEVMQDDGSILEVKSALTLE